MNKRIINILYTALLVLGISIPKIGLTQQNSDEPYINIGLKEYLELVLKHNLEYAAEKFNVSIAEAEVTASRVFPDPELSFEWSREGDENAYTTELEQTIELGKRRARINLAKSGQLMAHAELNDFLRNLVADATIDYLEAMRNRQLYSVTENSYSMVKQLAQADSVRLSLGEIMGLDALQSQLEAGMLFNELMGMETEKRNSFSNLSMNIGLFHGDTLYFPTENFELVEITFSLTELMESALSQRPDLAAAKEQVEFSRMFLKHTRAERRMDIDLKVGASNSKLNSSYFSPSEAEIMAGFAIPLKFSNLNKGEIRIAQFEIDQSELMLKHMEITVRNEVVMAYNHYQSMLKQIKNFSFGLLEQAKAVLDGRKYSYTRGESSLLEVLDAQRTYNELHVEYFETLFEYHVALVELERACGASLM